MQNSLSGWAALHQLAARRGDGLLPELLELAQRQDRMVQQGAVPLEVHAVSAGPAQQGQASTTFDGDNVVPLSDAASSSLRKNTG